MSIQLAGLHSLVRPYAEAALYWADRNGIKVTVTSVKRTWAEQTALYTRYQQALANGTFGQPGGLQYPANQPGDSAHQFGLAFDSVVDDSDLANWTTLREYFGFRVPSNDVIHAEVPNWRSWRDVLFKQGVIGR